MITIEQAIAFASNAHEGAVDKANKPYIFHVLRVMMSVTTDDEKLCAIFHDIIEDTNYTLDDLRNIGVPENIIVAVDAMTHKDSEDYYVYVNRAIQNPIAINVKLADLTDNISFDVSTIQNPTNEDFARGEKYGKAIDIIRKYKFENAI